MTRRIVVILLGAICLISSGAWADTLNGSGSWGNLATLTLNESPPPFWDNPSMDGSQQNVGYKLQPLLGSTGEYWSISGGVDNNVTFTDQGGDKELALLITIAGNVAQNKLYIYDASGSNTAGSKITVFGGSAPQTVTVSLPAAWTSYGFELIGPGGTFFSAQGHGEVSSDSKSNFAFFRQSDLSDTWWVGVEDLQDATGNGATGLEGLGDYNDLVVRISAIPLPSSVLLLGTGLLGLACLGWRRRKAEI